MNFKVIWIVSAVFLVETIRADYWEERSKIIELEATQAIGGNITLSAKEQEANEVLMAYKLEEYNRGIVNQSTFLPAQHFFRTKRLIELSNIYKFIRGLPKGAALHAHDFALASGDYLYNLTFTPGLYGCISKEGRLQLSFLIGSYDPNCDWIPMEKLREDTPDFEKFILTQLGIVVDNPEEVYKNSDYAWVILEDVFSTITPLLTYKPIFKAYFYQALKELYEDNTKYMEFRGTLPEVYDFNGKIYGPVEVLGLYQETLEKFLADYPDFLGAKFIYAPRRKVDNDTMKNYIKIAIQLKETYPDLFAGFDLVGHEVEGRPLVSFVEEIRKAPEDMKFFFHAGETNWYGTPTDANIIDAILLGSIRIGHGFAIVKHPKLLELVKQRDIAIEVCPISNQVLSYVKDIRNHPAVSLIAGGYPVVIGQDDPGTWGSKALSFDWYMAFLGMTSRETDLRFLKQLAMNAIKYSAMSGSDKSAALSQWQHDWDKFIDNVLVYQKYVEYEVVTF